MPDPSEGLLLCNRFILRRRLGQGGMGEVWLASDKALEDQVALKILKPSLAVSADGIRLLREECRHSRRLTHPSIVRIYDFHSHETHHFISMEYVPGTDFRRFVGSPPMECLPKLLPVIDALEYSHAQGFIHRDIKTSNILYDQTGHARLTDFGIAAIWARDQKPGASASGGSPYAMSPQQVMQHSPSPADDIYALGALIYELLTGLPPFFPHINTEKILRVLPAPMRSLHPIPAWLEDLVMRMLAKSPVARPASMKELSEQLRSQLNLQSQTTTPPTLSESRDSAQTKTESITTLNQPTPELKKNPHKQNRILLTVWAAFVVLLAMALAVLLYFPQRLHPPQTSGIAETAPKAAREPQQPILGDTAARPTQGSQPLEQARPAQEQKGSLSQALAEFQKASKLNPESKAVQTAISRINTKIGETRFNRYMSEGLAALDRDRFKTAQRAFSEARKLKPNARGPVDAMTRLELKRRATQIEEQRRQATALETEERWQQALKHYNTALSLDPTLVFAQQGKARSARLAELTQALDFHINNARRMSNDAVLEQAENIRDEARSINNPGAGLRTQISRLSDTIEAARTPVLMRLESDNHTEVAVYRIGKLGRFKSHELRLRPGTYTVVGTREGYRDIRHQFIIVAGHAPAPLVVRCEERI